MLFETVKMKSNLRKIILIFTLTISALSCWAQGWPEYYNGVMLQGFYWDSFSDSQWSKLESEADELSEFFNLVWIPQSGCSSATISNGSNSMGYDDVYWFENYNSSFGTEVELRSMISTFKSKGIGIIADIVINHRYSLPNTWMGFPAETYKGVTYSMGAADICGNDDGGNTTIKAEVAPTGANDSGDDFNGGRDIDHSSANVQAMVKAYLDMILNDMGYAGFRYDMVKGYAPAYTKLYNEVAKPTFSVGEYWDGYAPNVINWIKNTGYTSAAFDFPLKYKLRDCCNNGSGWGSNLGSAAYLANNNDYKRYAVTFVDNHDTYARNNDGEIKKNILAANAFILASPGTPCIFLPHWKQYKESIKQMIYARNLAKINNQSATQTIMSAANGYEMKATGTDGKGVIIAMGQPGLEMVVNNYFLISEGDNYRYYLEKSVESAWASRPSGEYDEAFNVKLSAISEDASAKIVYTLDGAEPTATSATVSSGTEINISKNCTLKAALLSNGTIKGTITRNYQISAFKPHDITVYVNADAAHWSSINFWTWGGDGSHNSAHSWPGDGISKTIDFAGKKWYCKTFTMNAADDFLNLVVSTGTGSPQTVDVNNINSDVFLEISSTQTGGRNKVNDVTAETIATKIGTVNSSKDNGAGDGIYNIQGMKLHTSSFFGKPNARRTQVYILNGKKFVVK